MKKLLFIFLILGLALSNATWAQDKIEINFFFSETCPHCAQEKEFLEKLEQKYPEIELQELKLPEAQNIELLRKLYDQHQIPSEMQGLVPISFIGNRYFIGYGGDEKTGQIIEDYIIELVEAVGPSDNEHQPPSWPATPIDLDRKIKIPIIGEITLSTLSPLSLAVALGALDGFNACAMVALGFLLAILVSTGVREKVLWIGGTFILVSGIVYFLFISTWFNLFLVLEQIKFITSLVGAIVILLAIFLLKDYFEGIICKLCEIRPGKQGFFTKLQKHLFRRMEKTIKSEAPLSLILLGVAGVAAGVNMVELVCSFGFPLAFTKILASFQLSNLSYYSYLLVYILFYMLDDFLIFIFAVYTLRITQISQKYLKVITLISGILLLLLGLIILIKPEILMFG